MVVQSGVIRQDISYGQNILKLPLILYINHDFRLFFLQAFKFHFIKYLKFRVKF